MGVGHALVDVLVHADDALLKQQGMAKGAMTLIDAERADALYGVTMRGDGITTVISQRMRGQELAASSG